MTFRCRFFLSALQWVIIGRNALFTLQQDWKSELYKRNTISEYIHYITNQPKMQVLASRKSESIAHAYFPQCKICNCQGSTLSILFVNIILFESPFQLPPPNNFQYIFF